ncbi:hypothetical protein LTR84_003869 [Exophiala bonariae]|uniref:Apurinic-apyrimidinic endonuclease 1 n=1 Tax=Exophiala bonariae TaxID=1690606 RepID=A0AAV9N6Q8_9EURO|nr:hypothetical protein LTR84_003869 [Exophiala bonariae]
MTRGRKPVSATNSSLQAESPASKKRKRDETDPNEITPTGKRTNNVLMDSPRSSRRSRPVAASSVVKEEQISNVQVSQNGSITIKESEEIDISIQKPLGSKARKSKATKAELVDEQGSGSEGDVRPKQKSKAKAKPVSDEGDEAADATKSKRKRKTQEEKDAEAMPLAARTIGSKMFVGAHTSIAKGVENAVTNCLHIGGNAFACFLKSQRKWENPPLQDVNRDAFHKALVEHKYDGMKHVVPHGSYLVNLANADKDKAKQSYDAFIDDLRRCEALGIKYYNFHPGGAGTSSVSEAIGRLAANLNRALSETSTVVPLLENMAGHGTLLGGRFSDLRDVIAQIKPEFKSRIGVCIDTCHAFAAGYDLRTPEAFQKTMKEFDDVVGIQYLKAMHLNDSKAPFASHRDLHQNIGLGFLGLRAFHNVMNEPRFQGLPLILETPSEKADPSDPKGKKMMEDKSVWAKEIKLLESLVDMDPESQDFKSLEKDLSNKGKKERAEMQAQFDKKQEKENKKLAKDLEKGQRSLADMFAKNGGAPASKALSKPKKKSKRETESDSSDLSSVGDLSDDEEGHVH